MDKKKIYHIIEWSVAIAACVFLVWKIVTYEDYADLLAALRIMSWPQWLAVLACVALMPVNMALEAWRWRTLVPMSRREAQRQVYYSKLAGLITPWRLGEYPARGVLLVESQESRAKSQNVWAKVLSMGAVGSITMTAAIVIAGLVGIAFSPAVLALLGNSYLYSIGFVMIILTAFFLLAPRVLKRYVSIDQELLLRSLGQSFVRLLCWCIQLALVLWALGGIGNLDIPDILKKSGVYYLFVTITPNVPIVEAGVRGAWAIVIFGTMNAALAGVLLWVINTLLPCVLWPFLRKKQ